ncbi:MAG: hypothetical protein CFH32_00002 [Alphaproteobacteria bacterium MarineAlpha9_Bin2]|nr:MAG: hypothetical protein CFH32_00002 [Alphaproteobacteria bacterium MarineAlpha9_Bin2]
MKVDLKFVVSQNSKPYFESSALTGTVPKIYFKTEIKSVDIQDIRSEVLTEKFSIDKNGFELLTHETKVKDLYDDARIQGEYTSELKDFLIKLTGADGVEVFDYTRRSDGKIGAKNPDGVRGPADRVHIDYTAHSGPKRAIEILGIEKYNKVLESGGRVVQLNVWRPINGPVKRSPIAFADASSIARENLVATDQIFYDRVGEIYHILHSDEQRWKWVSLMDDNEILLLKGWDTLNDGRAIYTPHGSFILPDQKDSDPPRESIEARVFFYFFGNKKIGQHDRNNKT